MSKVKKGDRVKVTIEGVLTEAGHPNSYVLGDGHKNAIFSTESKDYEVTIEKIEPPVEVFKPGDTVRDKNLPAFTFLVLHGGYVDLHNKVHHPRSTIFTSERYEKVE